MIRYRLDARAARRRALAAAGIGAGTTLVPVLFAIVLLSRAGWAMTPAFWATGAALATLAGTRAYVAYESLSRKLRALVVTASEDGLRVETAREAFAIARDRAARIVEVDGPLGGLRVESRPDEKTQAVFVAYVPRGSDGFADVRQLLERWRPIERRGRRGPAVRLGIGVLVVAAIFFLPFVLDDFVVRSKVVVGALVLCAWLVMRALARTR